MENLNILILPEFLENVSSLPKDIKAKIFKCLSNLSTDYRYPGLETKKIKASKDNIFECRIDRKYRLIYDRKDQMLRCWGVGKHDEALDFGMSLIISDDVEFITYNDDKMNIKEYYDIDDYFVSYNINNLKD